MGHYLALFVLWATLMNLTLEFQMTEQEMKEMKGKFCGSHLSEMLSVVCNGVYNNRQKKNNMYGSKLDKKLFILKSLQCFIFLGNELSNRDDYQDIEPIEYSDEPMLSFPFKSKLRAKSIIPVEFRKRSRGVASECCHKSCSLWEMAGYCGEQ